MGHHHSGPSTRHCCRVGPQAVTIDSQSTVCKRSVACAGDQRTAEIHLGGGVELKSPSGRTTTVEGWGKLRAARVFIVAAVVTCSLSRHRHAPARPRRGWATTRHRRPLPRFDGKLQPRHQGLWLRIAGDNVPSRGDAANFRIADNSQLGHGEWGYVGDANELRYVVWTDTEIKVAQLGASAGDALVVAIWKRARDSAAPGVGMRLEELERANDHVRGAVRLGRRLVDGDSRERVRAGPDHRAPAPGI